MAVGVGFAILENSMILTDNVGAVTVLWATARGFSASLMHGLCTVVAGTGITYVKKQKAVLHRNLRASVHFHHHACPVQPVDSIRL